MDGWIFEKDKYSEIKKNTIRVQLNGHRQRVGYILREKSPIAKIYYYNIN